MASEDRDKNRGIDWDRMYWEYVNSEAYKNHDWSRNTLVVTNVMDRAGRE